MSALGKFRQIKGLINRIVFIVILFAASKSCLTDYVNGADKTKIEQYQQMIDDKSVVEAKLSESYTERTIKVLKVPIKSYDFSYTFSLENKFYKGDITLKKLPESLYIDLYYLKDNPNITSLNPYDDLENEKEKESSLSNLFWGILWGLIAIGLLLTFIPIFGRTKKSGAEINQEEKKRETTYEKSNLIAVKDANSTTIIDEKPIDKEDHSRFMPK